VTKPARTLLIILIVVIFGVAIVSTTTDGGGIPGPFGGQSAITLRYDELITHLDGHDVETATWREHELSGELKNGSHFTVSVPDKDSAAGNQLTALLASTHTRFSYGHPSGLMTVLGALSFAAFPLMILAVLYFLLIRPAQRLNPPTPAIAIFAGSASQTTGTFTVPSGKRAYMVWSTSPTDVDGSFVATVKSADDGAIAQPIAGLRGEGSGTTYCSTQGRLYIDVSANEPWTIRVYLV